MAEGSRCDAGFWGNRQNIGRLLAGILMVYAIMIWVTFRSYGITIDEPPLMNYGEAVYEWYTGAEEASNFFNRIEDLGTERYGALFDLTAYAASQILPFAPFDTRHLVNAVVGLLGVFVVFRLGTRLGTPVVGLLAAVLLLLMPRYYGHAFNNPKDIPFAVSYLLSLYQVVCSLSELPTLSWKRVVFIGLSFGLALGTRVGGLILFFYLSIFWGLRYLQLWRQSPQHWMTYLKHWVVQVVGVLLVTWLVMLAFWPRAQQEPLAYPFDTLQHFSNLTLYNTTFFDGRTLRSTDIPRHYALQWFLMIVPELHFICLIAGFVWIIYRYKIFAWSYHFLQWALVVFAMVFPLFYVFGIHAPLHDGFRHLLFILPPFTIVCAGGLLKACGVLSLAFRRLLAVVMVFLALLTFWDMVRLHPHEYIYFNRIFAGGLTHAAERYSTDYWENSYKEGVAWLSEHMVMPGDRRLRVHAASSNAQFLLDDTLYEYVEVPRDIDVYLSTTRDDGHKLVPGEIVHKVEREGVALLYIIRPDISYQLDPFFANAQTRNFNLARKANAVGDFETALRMYREILALYPQNPAVYNNIGGCLLDLRRYEEASEAFEQALALNPDYVKARMRLGLALFYQNKLDESLVMLYQALQQAPEDIEVLQSLGLALSQKGDLTEAIAMFQRVLVKEPNHAKTAGTLGVLFCMNGNNQEAIPLLLRAEQWNTQDLRYPLALGYAYDRLGQKDAAIGAYQRLLQLDPGNAEIKTRLSELLQQ